MVKATCPSCGAPGIVGKECEYCGTLIPKARRASKKKDTKTAPKKEMDDEDPVDFWYKVCPKGYEPLIFCDEDGNLDESLYPSKIPYIIVSGFDEEGIINLEGKFVKGPDHMSYGRILPGNYDYIYYDYFDNMVLSSLTTGEEFKIGEGFLDWELTKELDANARFLAICEDSLWTAIFDRRQKKLAKLNKPVLPSECKLLDKTVNDYFVQFVLGRGSNDNVTITIENDEANVTRDIFWEEVCPKGFMPYYFLDEVKELELGDVSKLSYMIVVNRENQKLHGTINREGQFVKDPEYVTYAKLFADNCDYIFRNRPGYRLTCLATREEFKLGRIIDIKLSKVIDANYRYILIKENSHWTSIFDRKLKKRIKFGFVDSVPVAYRPLEVVNNNNILKIVFARTSKEKMIVTIENGRANVIREGIKNPSLNERMKKEWGISIFSIVGFIILASWIIYGIYCCYTNS